MRSQAEGCLHAADRAMTRHALSIGLSVALGASVLLGPAMLNRRPFIFWDTAQYLALGDLVLSDHPDHAIIIDQNDPSLLTHLISPEQSRELLASAASYLGARSIFYSLFLRWTTSVASMWGVAYLQCLFVAATLRGALAIIWDDVVSTPSFLLFCAALAAATPAGVFAALLMPDIFAAPLILLIPMLFTGWNRLGRLARAGVALGLCISVMVHLSHLPIALLTGIAAALILLARTRRFADLRGPALLFVVSLGTALAANAMLNRYATESLGMELHKPPFLMVRIIDDGPGRQFLEQQCASSSYTICAYADRILKRQRGGDRINWGLSASEGGVYQIEDLSVREALRREDLKFVRDSVLSALPQQLFASAANVARLLVSFRMDGLLSGFTFRYQEYRDKTNWIGSSVLLQNLPGRAACERQDDQPCGDLALRKLRVVHYLACAAAIGVIAWQAFCFVARHGLRLGALDRVEAFVATVVSGVVFNALVCGVLSGPYDRYQARVVWLLPATAIALLFLVRDRLRRDSIIEPV
jgi:hypothetical protein